MELKEILLESDSHQGLHIEELMKSFMIFKDRTLIFLYRTDNELQVICVDGTTMKIVKDAYIIESKDPVFRTPYGRNTTTIFNLKSHFKTAPQKVGHANFDAIFYRIVKSFKNTIIISNKEELSFLSRQYLWGKTMREETLLNNIVIPALNKLRESKLLNKFRKFKLVKLSGVNVSNYAKKSSDSNITFDKYTDPVTKEEFLKIYYGQPTSNLGEISPEILTKIMNPNFAPSNIDDLTNIFSSIISFLKENPDLDLSVSQKNSIDRVKSKIQKKSDKEKISESMLNKIITEEVIKVIKEISSKNNFVGNVGNTVNEFISVKSVRKLNESYVYNLENAYGNELVLISKKEIKEFKTPSNKNLFKISGKIAGHQFDKIGNKKQTIIKEIKIIND